MHRRIFLAAGLAGLGLGMLTKPLAVIAAGPTPLAVGAAVNKAGRQRMLSQRMAKAWLMLGRNILKDRAAIILKDSMALFEAQLAELASLQPNDDLRVALASLGEEWKGYKALLLTTPSADGAKKLYELNEKVLAAAHKLTQAYEKLSGTPGGRLVNLAGRQRMLSQRMAKFYFFQQWGVNVPQSQAELEKARKEFTAALAELSHAPQTTPQIKSELDLVAQQWVFFQAALTASSDDAQRAAANVATTSERILEQMDGAVGLFEKLAALGNTKVALA